MTRQRVIGLGLIVVGIGLIAVGAMSTDSFADRVHESFTGRYTKETMTYFISGGITAVVGAVVAILPMRKS